VFVRICEKKKIYADTGTIFCKIIHLLSSEHELQTYMIKVHLACQNYQKLQVQFLWHEMMCMDYVFHAGSAGVGGGWGAQNVYDRV
jgi:hypothetical protein